MLTQRSGVGVGSRVFGNVQKPRANTDPDRAPTNGEAFHAERNRGALRSFPRFGRAPAAHL